MLLRITFVFILYVIIVGLLFILKPAMMFEDNGRIKQVGFSRDNRSLLSLYIVLPILAIILYIIFLAWTK